MDESALELVRWFEGNMGAKKTPRARVSWGTGWEMRLLASALRSKQALFIEADKQEQEIAEGCKRLIQNAITCWNYLYLSQKLAEAEASTSRETLLQAIASGSLVSWQHINLLGEYDFSDERLQDSVGIKLPPNLTNEPLPHVADQSGQLSLFVMISALGYESLWTFVGTDPKYPGPFYPHS